MDSQHWRWLLHYPIFINVLNTRAPSSGSSGGFVIREINFKKLLKCQRSVSSIKNANKLCFARSLAVGKALADGIARKKNKTL